jgi:hypothetical protein
MSTDIVAREKPELATKSSSLLVTANAIQIQTDEHYMLADDFLGNIKALQKEIDAGYNEIIAGAYANHKLAVATKKRYSDPVDEAEKVVKRKMGDYQAQREAEARREQVAAEAVARKAADDAQLAQAVALEAAGHKEAAQAVLSAPPAPAAILPMAVGVPVLEGTSFRKLYSCRVTDLHKLAVFAVANPAILASCLLPNEKSLDAMARAQKDSFCIPGCEVVVENCIAKRATP